MKLLGLILFNNHGKYIFHIPLRFIVNNTVSFYEKLSFRFS
jgi:hypothetical protein